MSVASEKQNWSAFRQWKSFGDEDPSSFSKLERLKFWGISGIARLWMHGLSATCDISFTGNKDGLELFSVDAMARAERGAIMLTWHNRVVGQMLFLGHRIRQNTKLLIDCLVSGSRDGEIIARIIRDHNAGIIRGSSSKDASKVLRLAVQKLQAGHFLALVSDGPRGPRYVAKPGPIMMAKESGAPIVPFTWTCTRTLQLYKTWDQLMIPLPRARIVYTFGEPLYVDKDASPRDIARARREVQKRLMDLTIPADEQTIISRLIPKPKPGHLLKRREANELPEHRK
ncbi:MAG: lysophospholipid acyltransferase family protein [Planctomycetes bacterium]|nr:lysophospholipid acyltransferase family protein [Planctomycetota bacterium]